MYDTNRFRDAIKRCILFNGYKAHIVFDSIIAMSDFIADMCFYKKQGIYDFRLVQCVEDDDITYFSFPNGSVITYSLYNTDRGDRECHLIVAEGRASCTNVEFHPRLIPYRDESGNVIHEDEIKRLIGKDTQSSQCNRTPKEIRQNDIIEESQSLNDFLNEFLVVPYSESLNQRSRQ